MIWESEKIKNRRYREKIPVIRINPKNNEIRKYKSMKMAAYLNGDTYPDKIKQAIENGTPIMGYYFDYV